jgi:hypothetical protein
VLSKCSRRSTSAGAGHWRLEGSGKNAAPGEPKRFLLFCRHGDVSGSSIEVCGGAKKTKPTAPWRAVKPAHSIASRGICKDRRARMTSMPGEYSPLRGQIHLRGLYMIRRWTATGLKLSGEHSRQLIHRRESRPVHSLRNNGLAPDWRLALCYGLKRSDAADRFATLEHLKVAPSTGS